MILINDGLEEMCKEAVIM